MFIKKIEIANFNLVHNAPKYNCLFFVKTYSISYNVHVASNTLKFTSNLFLIAFCMYKAFENMLKKYARSTKGYLNLLWIPQYLYVKSVV